MLVRMQLLYNSAHCSVISGERNVTCFLVKCIITFLNENWLAAWQLTVGTFIYNNIKLSLTLSTKMCNLSDFRSGIVLPSQIRYLKTPLFCFLTLFSGVEVLSFKWFGLVTHTRKLPWTWSGGINSYRLSVVPLAELYFDLNPRTRPRVSICDHRRLLCRLDFCFYWSCLFQSCFLDCMEPVQCI